MLTGVDLSSIPYSDGTTYVWVGEIIPGHYKVMEIKLGVKVKIVRDNSGNDNGIGLVGTVVEISRNYNSFGLEYVVEMADGERWYCDIGEIEPYQQVVKESIYINQIEVDLNKLK